jgi:hypothetical protein
MFVMWNILRRLRLHLYYFGEIKLIYLHKCVHNHYQKE